MLEYILNKLLVLGEIHIIIGSSLTLLFTLFNYMNDDEENNFTFTECLTVIFFYPIVLYYAFKKL